MMRKRSLLISVSLISASLLISGYVLNSQREAETGAIFHPYWDSGKPLRFFLWEGFNDALESVEPGTDVGLVIRSALESWARVSSLTILLEETGQTEVGIVTGGSGPSAGADGFNLITLPAPGSPDEDLIPEGALAVTWSRFFISGENSGKLSEVDILFSNLVDLSDSNGNRPLWSNRDSGDLAIEAYNLFDIALHEVGHALNLAHSPALNSTMFPRGGDFDFGFNRLSWDDIAAVNATPAYRLPELGQITGSIEGKVTLAGGGPVFGASVSAIDELGIAVAGAVTLPDGSFKIENLPPSSYILYVEPLDGPMTTADLSGGLFAALNTSFLPRFFADSIDPQVQVKARESVLVGNLQVFSGEPAIRPVRLGRELPDQSFLVSQSPAEAFPGEEVRLAVVGPGLDLVPGSRFGLLGFPQLQANRFASGTSSDNLPLSFYSFALPPESVRGPHSILLSGGQERRVLPGALNIFDPLRFERVFAQFVHSPSLGNSQLFLINTAIQGDSSEGFEPAAARVRLESRRGGEENNGEKVPLPLESPQIDPEAEVSLKIQPGASLEVKTAGEQNFVGSFRVRADQPVEAAVLLETQAGLTGVGSSPGVYSFVAPIMMRNGGEGGYNTGIAITNLDDRPAQVFLRLQDQSGKPVSQAETVLELPPNGHRAAFPGDLFQKLPTSVTSGSFEGTLLVTANRLIAATVIRTTPGVLTTFPVILTRSLNRAFFAQFAHLQAEGNRLSSELILVNPSGVLTAESVTIQVRNSSGSPAGVSLNNQVHPDGKVEVSLPPLGMIRLQTTGNIPLPGGTVELNSTVPVGGVVVFTSDTLGTAGVGESLLLRRVVIPVSQDPNRGIGTGVALFNPSNETLRLELALRDQQGMVVASGEVSLEGWQQLSRFVDQLALDPKPAARFSGSLWLKATGPARTFAATAIRQSPGGLTTFPAISLDRVIR